MSDDYLNVWGKCLRILKDLVDVKTFRTWFEPINPIRLQENTLTIEVPNKFFYEWLESQYINELSTAISKVLGEQGKLTYQFKLSEANTTPNSTKIKNNLDVDITPENIKNPFVIPGIKRVKFNPQLNPDYVMETLIEGDCNELAKSAGKAIAKKPGGTGFNPLFVYGDTGLGKTHLIQAIGNQVLRNFPDINVLYVSSEKFTNQLIQAIKNGSISDFTNFYQMIDVLIVDDIQFFAGKKKTQEIFFNIFNHLQLNGKQIILSADKPPKEISGIMDRLLSRFKWGLQADLHQPDLETRIAIMEAKMERESIVVPREVSEFICYHVKNNIRELEGVLIQLIAQATLRRRQIDMELAKEVVQRFKSHENKEITVEHIKEMVAEYFNVDVAKLDSKSRKREIATARHVSIFLSKQYTKNTLESIGSYFGGRHHSTILHSFETVQDMMDTDTAFKDVIADLERKVKHHIA